MQKENQYNKRVFSREHRLKLSISRRGKTYRKTHGMSKTRFYLIFKGLHNRCTNKNNQAYNSYGGRGIKCLWNSFEDFNRDMLDSYLKHVDIHGEIDTTIERIDSNGNYSKENCRWATRSEQGKNTRRIRKIEWKGETKSIAEWARMLNMPYKRLTNRLYLGWTIQEALDTPRRSKGWITNKYDQTKA